MKIQALAESRTMYEISNHVLHKERFDFIKIIFWVIAALPLAVIYKLWFTLLKGAGVAAAGFFLAATLGFSNGFRELFVKRVSSFAANLADWVLYPFAVTACFSRLLFATFFVRY